MDALLGQLRQQMHELSLQGDGFTLQMWKLYNLLEDFASHVCKNNRASWSAMQADVSLDMTDQIQQDKLNKITPFPEGIASGHSPGFSENSMCLQPVPNIFEYCSSECKQQHCCKVMNDNTCVRTSVEGKVSFHCNADLAAEADFTKDYASYAGSTSADSGYKSCESTASEMSNIGYYDSKLQFEDVECSNLKNSFLKQSAPKIRMGTKAVIWQTKKPVLSQSLPKLPLSKRTDTRFNDTNLDHLMYLRASIMNVMQEKKKCISSIVTDDFVHHDSKNTSGIENSSDVTDIPFNSQGVRTCSETPLLEKEIDEILYGKAEYYDLESVENFPCSYVTMIEEKYKKGRKSKDCQKIKNQKIDHTSSEITSSETNDNIKYDKEKPVHSIEHDNKLSEVARCMLEIIQDLSQQGGSVMEHGISCANVTIDSAVSKIDFTPELSPLPDSEYHIYEEIPNDYSSKKLDRTVFQEPPPLPKRQPAMFHNTFGLSNSVENTLHKPKQRSNLYSLFNDRGTRRCLSASLAEEWKEHAQDQIFDEYGFRRNKV